MKITILRNSREAFEAFYEILVSVLALLNDNWGKKAATQGSCFYTSVTATSVPVYLLVHGLDRESGRKNPNSIPKSYLEINSVKYHFLTSLTDSLIFIFGNLYFLYELIVTSRSVALDSFTIDFVSFSFFRLKLAVNNEALAFGYQILWLIEISLISLLLYYFFL